MALTDKCLGTLWWAFASLEELESVRLRAWRGQAEGAAEIELERADPELHEEMERERSEKYGDGPAMTIGENPMMLAMVRENKEVVFEASI